MNKLYQKSEILFAIAWIIAYVIGSSITGEIHHTVLLAFHLLLCATALIWMKRNGFFRSYGLCAPASPARKFLWYIPLVITVSSNLWLGTARNMPPIETVSYILSMLCVGFLEEIIFRGFLFKAMCKDCSIKTAVIVSSVTFGIGHIINLFNGSGADIVSNLCQIVSAMAFGFLFVIIFLRGQTLLPCIATHSLLNAVSAFSNDAAMTDGLTILTSLILTFIALGYAAILLKTLPSDK